MVSRNVESTVQFWDEWRFPRTTQRQRNLARDWHFDRLFNLSLRFFLLNSWHFNTWKFQSCKFFTNKRLMKFLSAEKWFVKKDFCWTEWTFVVHRIFIADFKLKNRKRLNVRLPSVIAGLKPQDPFRNADINYSQFKGDADFRPTLFWNAWHLHVHLHVLRKFLITSLCGCVK